MFRKVPTLTECSQQEIKASANKIKIKYNKSLISQVVVKILIQVPVSFSHKHIYRKLGGDKTGKGDIVCAVGRRNFSRSRNFSSCLFLPIGTRVRESSYVHFCCCRHDEVETSYPNSVFIIIKIYQKKSQ